MLAHTGATTRVCTRVQPAQTNPLITLGPAELGICRNPRYKLGQPCIDEYLALVPKSEPAADFDSRNAVYAMKYHALLSVMYFKDQRFKQVLIGELKALLESMDEPHADGGRETHP